MSYQYYVLKDSYFQNLYIFVTGIDMEKEWKIVIKNKSSLFRFNLKEIWKYRDLCFTFVKKNYTTMYKQTILGPLYMILAPLLTSGVFTLIFGSIAGISTDGTPQFLFYMAGNMMWSFFAGCMGDNMNILGNNAYIMGKVYFPRLIIPISSIITKIFKFIFELFMFFIFCFVFIARGSEVNFNIMLLALPLFMIQLALLGLGIGMIISSLTVKYKDLGVIAGFGMKIWMYVSPVIYPVSGLEGGLKVLAMCNPVAPVIEATRYAFFGHGMLLTPYLILSVTVTIIIFMTGLILFNKVEKDFIDTI